VANNFVDISSPLFASTLSKPAPSVQYLRL
jgi:hypothetical protein